MRRLFVANRGEIAVRIIRTARELGIETVLGYSSADRDSLARQLADDAFLGGLFRPRTIRPRTIGRQGIV